MSLPRQPLKDIANRQDTHIAFPKQQEQLLCDEHRIPVKLMTAVKDGPNGYSKKYYVCSHETPCDFFLPFTQTEGKHPPSNDSNVSDAIRATFPEDKHSPMLKTTAESIKAIEASLSEGLSKLSIKSSAADLAELDASASKCTATAKPSFASIRIPKKKPMDRPVSENNSDTAKQNPTCGAVLNAAPVKPLHLTRPEPPPLPPRPQFNTSNSHLVTNGQTGSRASRLGPLAAAAMDEGLRACYDALWRDPAPLAVPAGLRLELFPHQRASVAWMAAREGGPAPHGGVLADDMGLGKTIQLIALVLASPPPPARDRAAACAARSTLLVCPKSVLRQWAAEIGRAAPELRVYEYSGAGRRGPATTPARPARLPSPPVPCRVLCAAAQLRPRISAAADSRARSARAARPPSPPRVAGVSLRSPRPGPRVPVLGCARPARPTRTPRPHLHPPLRAAPAIRPKSGAAGLLRIRRRVGLGEGGGGGLTRPAWRMPGPRRRRRQAAVGGGAFRLRRGTPGPHTDGHVGGSNAAL